MKNKSDSFDLFVFEIIYWNFNFMFYTLVTFMTDDIDTWHRQDTALLHAFKWFSIQINIIFFYHISKLYNLLNRSRPGYEVWSHFALTPLHLIQSVHIHSSKHTLRGSSDHVCLVWCTTHRTPGSFRGFVLCSRALWSWPVVSIVSNWQTSDHKTSFLATRPTISPTNCRVLGYLGLTVPCCQRINTHCNVGTTTR